MTAQHTSEPWVVLARENDCPVIVNAEIKQGVGTIYSTVNAERIAACINACSGIDEPEETIGGMQYELDMFKRMQSSKGNAQVIDSVMKDRLALTRQIRCLLGALRQAEMDVEAIKLCLHSRDTDFAVVTLERIRAAIAKQEAEA